MRAGAIEVRLRLEKEVVTGRDALNGEIKEWRSQGDFWGEIVAGQGRQIHAADQVHEPATLDVMVRVGPAVTNLWRCIVLTGPLKGTDPLSIIAVLPTADRGKLRLQCVQGLRDG